MREAFVPANRLYDVESATPITHPVTDADVRHALEEREVRADGGHSSSDIDRPPFVDATAEYAVCHFCGQTWEPAAVDGFDLSRGDEYYPKMVPVCPEHAGGCR